MDGNWITDILSASFAFFSEKLSLLFKLLQTDITTFSGGDVWKVVQLISKSLLGASFSIMIICIYVDLIRTNEEILNKRWENYVWLLVSASIMGEILRASSELLVWIVSIGQDLVGKVIGSTGQKGIGILWTVPDGVLHSVDGLSTLQSVLIFIVVLIASLVIAISGITVLLIGYARIFNLYLHIAIAPIPIAFAVGKVTRPYFMKFLGSFIATTLQALAIVVACVIFSAFASSNNNELNQNDYTVSKDFSGAQGSLDKPNESTEVNVTTDGDTPIKFVWNYLLETSFLFLLLTGMIKGSDQLVYKLFGIG